MKRRDVTVSWWSFGEVSTDELEAGKNAISKENTLLHPALPQQATTPEPFKQPG